MPTLTPQPCLFALVPCAGVGARARASAGVALPKQYTRIGHAMVVGHTLRALQGVKRLTQTLVVLSPGDTLFAQAVPEHTAWVADVGGSTRAESVLAGLYVLKTRGAVDEDWVLVHDAARCLVQPAWIDALIDACLPDAVGGLLALPLADTLKHEVSGRVASTLDRSHKWLAQTPQMFRLGMLTQALEQADAAVTDEASAIEALGHAPLLVPGCLENFKLTYPADFALAERLLNPRS